MKNIISIITGFAMLFATFTTSVHAGFQTYQYDTGCAFNLEHETNNNTGAGASGTVGTGTTNTQTNTNQPINTIPNNAVVTPVFECPDPGFSGGSVALALFWGIFLGILLTIGTVAVIAVQVADSSLGDLLSGNALAPINETELGEYGTFELEPEYFPESDAAGLRFSFRF